MIKRKILSLILLCSILFIILFHHIPVVKGLTESHTDPQNDIFKVELATGKIVEIVSSHDEIDIVNITLDGQYTNVTFAGNITGHQMICNIYFFEHYDQNNLIFEYGVHYSNFTGTGFKVIFVNYTLSGEKYSYEYWNGTAWTPSNITADSIGTFSDYTIEATIPGDALTIYDNITWFAVSTYYEGNYGFLDCAPDSYCQIEETNGILGIFIFIGIFAIIAIAVFLWLRKRKSKETPLFKKSIF